MFSNMGDILFTFYSFLTYSYSYGYTVRVCIPLEESLKKLINSFAFRQKALPLHPQIRMVP